MSKFIHFSPYERQRIEKYLRQIRSLGFIAKKLDRSVSSVSDEIRLNSVNGEYLAEKAEHKARVRRQNSKLQCMKVAMDRNLKNFVNENVLEDQSPEGISGRLKNVRKDLQYASCKAIYKFVWSPHGRKIEKHSPITSRERHGGESEQSHTKICEKTIRLEQDSQRSFCFRTREVAK